MSTVEWKAARRDIAGLKRSYADWYMDEYLPTLQEFPPWLEQWQASWFAERVERFVADSSS